MSKFSWEFTKQIVFGVGQCHANFKRLPESGTNSYCYKNNWGYITVSPLEPLFHFTQTVMLILIFIFCKLFLTPVSIFGCSYIFYI